MSDETYEIILKEPNEGGGRKDTYYQHNGWTVGLESDGVLTAVNEHGTVILYNPYAWQQFRTYNIDTQEDADG